MRVTFRAAWQKLNRKKGCVSRRGSVESAVGDKKAFMKTYKHLFEDMVKEENIRECFLAAAKKKATRPEVARVLKAEREPGDNRPGPQCLSEHVKELQKILIEESYEPPEHKVFTINEYNCGKQREIIRPVFAYEQVVHHCIIRQLQPIILHGMYEHAIGSIPGRGPHSGAKTIRKWIDRRNGKKFYVLKADVRHCFNTEDINVIEGKQSRIIKDDKFLRLCNTVLEAEAKVQEVEKFIAEIAAEVGEENALEVARAMMEDEELLCGLPLGFVTSQWFTQLNYKEFDHKMKEEWGAEDYMRYADDIVVMGRNKKKLHEIRRKAEAYLETEMHQHLKRNWQVFRFEYTDKKTGKIRGRALDFMGFVFHKDRTTLRKSILCRTMRKARKISKKDRPTWYDAASMLSYMGWFKHTDTYGYYKDYIKPLVNIHQLKKIVSRHDRKEKKQYDKLVQGTKHGKTGGIRHNVQPDNRIPAAEH